MRNNKKGHQNTRCYICGLEFTSSIAKQKERRHVKNSKCIHCSKLGHFAKVSQNSTPVRKVDSPVKKKAQVAVRMMNGQKLTT